MLLFVVVVAGLLAVSGVGYLYVFSGVFGNEIYLSPTGDNEGILFSPGRDCQRICEGGVFVGCEKSFDDVACGISCRGAISVGPRKGEMPITGSTLCEYTECVCD